VLAGLGRGRRNRAMRSMLQEGRPAPSGFRLHEAGDGRLTCEAAAPAQYEGGHGRHGRCVVARLTAEGGDDAVQARARIALFRTALA
jgi:hypothetical protein